MQQPNSLPWYKGLSRNAQKAITRARTDQAKLQAIDAYIDGKVNVYLDMRLSQRDQLGLLHAKIEQLASSLCTSDAELLRARGDLFLDNLAGICNQWSRKSTFTINEAATAAFQADRAYTWDEGLAIVKQHVQKSVHRKQGPLARLEAMRQAKQAVQDATAFPKPAHWGPTLDEFIRQKAAQTPANPHSHSCEAAAIAINSASIHRASCIADRYFYSNRVSTWSVAVNEAHVEDKLNALLPRLSSAELQDTVKLRAEGCKQCIHFLLCTSYHRRQDNHAARYAANFAGVATRNPSRAPRVAIACADFEKSAVPTAGSVTVVCLPDGQYQLAHKCSDPDFKHKPL